MATRFARRILLAVTGLTPQVVTETLYALAVQRQPPFIPTEIHLLTTAEGAEAARLGLLSTDPGWFHHLCRDYELPAIAFDARHIQVLRDADGAPLDDIRTPADNQRAADAITELVRHYTADPAAALHVSIAGGRKTMGYYLGYALSLFGRPQDRLSHVLVSAPFEGCPAFYYPTAYHNVITLRDNKLADTRDAQVTLAEIPFVRLREGLNPRLLTGAASFGQAVAAAQRALQAPELVIDLAGRRLRAAGDWLDMAPVELAFYSLMARRQCQGRDGVRRGDAGLDAAFLKEYRQIVPEYSGELERCEATLAAGMSVEYFDQRKSRVNSTLAAALGPALAAPYLIRGEGRRPRTRYGLRLVAGAIRFGAIDPATSLRGGAEAAPQADT
ncbi:MAG: TIGR02584 family CRISPR-associated protein [Chromatiaceae bacterium]|nr:TIGR02584 family CRISPR-associated protein [Chromatiaceae bacterium]MBP6807218.1 TIGR02584 family CRISPR-associated protein [Chromatiaceae bacterium]MBP8282758.1 TIGR02584 family CRISPR-associated protein [Chromatiaceae bacterium]MBP8289078.1 TIGR02584 family CRISPR-associated protein [Chromatiaceae bacterium]